MKDRFMKNGVFSLEYDKETLRDMVLELQQENQKYKEVIDELNDLLIIKKARCLNEDNYILNVTDLDDILQVLKEDN